MLSAAEGFIGFPEVSWGSDQYCSWIEKKKPNKQKNYNNNKIEKYSAVQRYIQSGRCHYTTRPQPQHQPTSPPLNPQRTKHILLMFNLEK